ncbi:MAG: class A beta-lactamase, subclass A2 [Acidobacteriota bacterium]|nr:MAG: class A beta-lactamase, subclass A2 [Acidobacteriota bacterium]
MKKTLSLALLFLLFSKSAAIAHTTGSLQKRIEAIATSKNAVVGVAIVGGDGKTKVTVNGDRRFPMQSVFKYHIGLAMMTEIDKGKFTLDQQVEIKKHQLLPGLWSPLRDENPDGGSFSFSKLIEYSVSLSDNVTCDALLRLLGGPAAVERFIRKHGVKDISIKINEEQMQSNWDMMFQNWTTPKAANEVLKKFYENKNYLLTPKSHAFIWKVMRETSTGVNRLKGQLPAGTVVAHKTGWSGTNKTTGITAAVNDIGIVFLPNGKHFYISVFVSDSKEDFDTNERIIADIAKAAWDHFVLKDP